MSTQLIDLESGSTLTGDSGERTDVDAIKPIDAGERVQAAVIDRPFENLRARTEELRSKVEELLYRADADKWIITGGNTIGEVTVPGAAAFPTVSWDATTGLCIVSEAIVVQPFVAPSTDLFGFIDWAFTESVAPFGTVTFRFEANDDPLAGTILYDYQLANSLRVYWESSASLGAGVFCQATLEGSPVHMLKIVVRDDGTTTAAHVQAELNTILAPVVPDSILKFTLTGLGTTFVEWVETPGRPNEYMFNTYSREMHRMTKTVFDGFFVGSPLLTDGDGIGIWYEELTDSDTTQHGGRRQATPTTIEDISGLAPNTVVPVTKLFKFSTEPEKIPGCIPLCRRIGTYLVFIDGTVVAHGQTATLGGEGSIDDLLARYNAHVGGTAEKHAATAITTPAHSWIAATDVGSALEEIVDDLAAVGAGVSGASRIGNESFTTGSAHSEIALALPLHNQIDTLAGWVGERAHKTKGEKITGIWHHIGASTDTADYNNNATVRARWDASCSGGAAGPSVTIANIERGLSKEGLTSPETLYMWGNPRARVNDGSLGNINLDSMIMLNVKYDSIGLPETGMVSRVIVCGGHANDTIKIKDVYRIYAPEAEIDLTPYMPVAGAPWKIIALCACGDGAFAAMLQDSTPSPNQVYIVHCFRMTHTSGGSYAVTPYPGMMATGLVLPGVGDIDTNGPLSCNLTSDGTYIFTLNGWNTCDGGNVVSRITIGTTTITSGSGDASGLVGLYPTGGIVTDGSNVYFTVRIHLISTDLYLGSCRITNLALGSGLTDFPLPLSGDTARDVCCDGSTLYVPAETVINTYCLGAEVGGVISGGTVLDGTIGHCCFDGRNVWFNEFDSNSQVNLIGIDVARVPSKAAHTLDAVGARKYYLTPDDKACTGAEYMGRLLFDGGSVLAAMELQTGAVLTGHFYRLVCSTDRS